MSIGIEALQPDFSLEPRINRIVSAGERNALSKVRHRFEDNRIPIYDLPYHNSDHTRLVIRNTDRILRALCDSDHKLVSERDVSLGRLSAAYHDVVQLWELVDVNIDGSSLSLVKRKRFTGKNEEKSATEALEFLKKSKFPDRDKKTVEEAILVTIPAFDPQFGTVIQPFLTPETSVVARAVALADIGTAGLEGGERFLSDGIALFREEFPNFEDVINGALKLTDSDKEFLRSLMLNWLNSQTSFVEGRKARMAHELFGLPDRAKQTLLKLFDKFDDSISNTIRINQFAKSLNFEELLILFGYY